jgi:hypothetical protein
MLDRKEKREIVRLTYRGLSRRVAGKLSRTGLGDPLDIRRASDEQLLAIPGIEEGDVAEIRRKIG